MCDDLETAIAQHKQGDVQTATAVYEHICRREPDNPLILRYLGLAKFQLGRREAGLECLKRATTLAPKDVATWSDLGRMHAILGNIQQAIACFRQAVTADPDYSDGWHNLGAALRQARDVNGALAAYQQALALNPKRADTYLNLGNLLVDDNQTENAIESFKRAAALDPKLGQARASLAGELSGRGDVSEAEFIYRQAIALDPRHAQAWFGLGRTLEDLGHAERAAHCYRQVLRLHPQQPWALGQLLGLQGSEADDALIRAAQRTLDAEQTPDAAKALIGYGLGKVYGRRGDYDAAFAAFECANRARRAQAGPYSALRASDKSPLNFFHLSLIALLFLNARIVHCRRNPIDTCLSIYFENFRSHQTYATDLNDLAIYYRGYERLMEHWKSVLPLKMHECRYEQSVADVERQARELVVFMDLPWDERCLDFHQSQRAVQTPSRWQVRQPIYSSSVGRWRRYEQHLGALKTRFPEALGG